MEGSLTDGAAKANSRSDSSVNSYMSKTVGSTSTMRSNVLPGSSTASVGSSTMKIIGASKSALVDDLGRNKGAVLKKGGLFVRAGGRKARQAGLEAKGAL